MSLRKKLALLAPALALGLALAAVPSAHAQVSGSFNVWFGTTPHWTYVNGTRVEVIRSDEAPDYDIFRYNGRYYVYNDNRWYSSDRPTGDYSYVYDVRSIPIELRQVPRSYWRVYPSYWSDDDVRDDRSYGRDRDYDRDRSYDRDRDYDRGQPMTFRIDLRHRPRFVPVRGSSVMVIASQDRSDYDMFKYRGNYYVYEDGRWYMSTHWRGPYNYIRPSEVPASFTRVPRNLWLTYPAEWPNRRHRY